jgi:hypothetical protein
MWSARLLPSERETSDAIAISRLAMKELGVPEAEPFVQTRHSKGDEPEFSPNALSPREQQASLTDCIADIAECSTGIESAQTICGAATEQYYI